MKASEERQAEELDALIEARLAGSGRHEAELPAGEAKLAAEIVGLAQSVRPDAGFVDGLQTRLREAGLGAASYHSPGASRTVALRPGRAQARPFAFPRFAFAAAAIGLLAVVVGLAWLARPQEVSAQQVLQKARESALSPSAGGVSSYVLSTSWHAQVSGRTFSTPGGPSAGNQIVSTMRRWYQAPNRWRAESETVITSPDGKESSRSAWVQVADGTSVWNYDSASATVTVNPISSSASGPGTLPSFGENVDGLDALFRQAAGFGCYDPKVTGSETVAGRPTYVVDLGVSRCPSASAPEMNGRMVLWIDRKTYFLLKQELYALDGSQVIMSGEVTSVEYGASIDAERFTFTPPAGSKMVDNRPKPTPSAEQYTEQLAQIARQVDFPLLVPSDLPPDLVPLQPRLDSASGSPVELYYVPSGQAAGAVTAGADGLTIREQRATYSEMVNWAEGADPVTIGSGQGWLRPGVQNADGTGTDSAAILVKDGTLVAISSFRIPPEQLVKVAASLQVVPGSHAALPDPTPPSMAGVRARATFPIFVPTQVPAGLVPEPPVTGDQPNDTVQINYHAADGSLAMTVLNGPAGCCLDADPRKGGTEVMLPNGIRAHLFEGNAQSGGPLLWWNQEGSYIAVSGAGLDRPALLEVAGSMSKTADLSGVEAITARPIPTTVPTPAFRVLRPTWLPESMTVREQNEGAEVVIGFDSHPADPPHDVVTLRETPKAIIGPEGAPDPQARRETIGGNEVTVIYRGASCISFQWFAGDLQLVLTNAYDPPGHPRYSCEQMKQILASIK